MKRLLTAVFVSMTAIATISGCAVTSGQSTMGEYVDDATLTARVKARLARDPEASAMRTQVETRDGVVQLSGFAVSEAERSRAASLTREVPGVRSVRNDIIIRPPQR